LKKNALISLVSFQDDEDMLEVVTPGDFYKKEDLYIVEYDETKISGMEGTRTTLKIGNDNFTLLREGNTHANMNFQNGKECFSIYDTPYGVLQVKIKTKDLLVNVDDQGGEVLVNYNMVVSGNNQPDTKLKVNIRKLPN